MLEKRRARMRAYCPLPLPSGRLPPTPPHPPYPIVSVPAVPRRNSRGAQRTTKNARYKPQVRRHCFCTCPSAICGLVRPQIAFLPLPTLYLKFALDCLPPCLSIPSFFAPACPDLSRRAAFCFARPDCCLQTLLPSLCKALTQDVVLRQNSRRHRCRTTSAG